MDKWKAWTNGQAVDAETGKTYAVFDPATEEEIAHVPMCEASDARKAVESAQRAFPIWSGKSQIERSNVIYELAHKLRRHAPELATLDTRNHGSPIRRAFDAVTRSADALERTAEASMIMMKNCIPTGSGAPFYLRHRPLGVCALVLPWNASFQTTIKRMASALAIGNTCVIKPPSALPLVALQIGEILESLDIPSGTVNILPGPDYALGGAIAFHPGVDSASFTAVDGARASALFPATEVACARASELGDRNRFAILEDADLDGVMPKAIFASFNNTGMACALPGRYYVHHRLYNEFTDRFAAAAKAAALGNPTLEATQIGPLLTAMHRDRVERFIDSGLKQGATLIAGGKRPTDPSLDRGYFITPAVFADVTPGMTFVREEVYGPVACISKVSSEKELAELIYDFSLERGVSVWTGSEDRALGAVSATPGAVVWINGHIVMPEQAWDEFGERNLEKKGLSLPSKRVHNLT